MGNFAHRSLSIKYNYFSKKFTLRYKNSSIVLVGLCEAKPIIEFNLVTEC